jgi:lysophospholipase L1-like esterase
MRQELSMINVLCFGDSNTYGWNPSDWGRYAPDVRWPGVLQRELGSGYHVIEEGCGGRTAVMDDGLEPFVSGIKYLEPCLRSHCPLDRVIFMLGTNDLKRRYALSAQDIANGMARLLSTVESVLRFEQKAPPRMMLVSPIHIGPRIVESKVNFEMFDFEYGIDKSKELAPFFRQVAERYGSAFFDAATVAEPSEEDSVHLSAEGHLALGKAIAREIHKDEAAPRS